MTSVDNIEGDDIDVELEGELPHDPDDDLSAVEYAAVTRERSMRGPRAKCPACGADMLGEGCPFCGTYDCAEDGDESEAE